MLHEVMDIVRDVASGAIILLLGVLLKRHLARFDAHRKAAQDWREGVDTTLEDFGRKLDGLERRKHPRDSASGKKNGLDKHSDAPSGNDSRVRRPRPPDED